MEMDINQVFLHVEGQCPCGSKGSYAACCEPYLTAKLYPVTPEQLMRSRYTAYCLANIDYIEKTMQGRALLDFDTVGAKRWACRVSWIKLNILNTCFDTPDRGYVEFIVTLVEGSILKRIHEKSEFIRENNRWCYIDGVIYPVSDAMISRSSQCPCGSQKKFKNCHEKIKSNLRIIK